LGIEFRNQRIGGRDGFELCLQIGNLFRERGDLCIRSGVIRLSFRNRCGS
jgi:hypothetical protein